MMQDTPLPTSPISRWVEGAKGKEANQEVKEIKVCGRLGEGGNRTLGREGTKEIGT